MKKIYYLMMCCLAVGLAACSDKDDDKAVDAENGHESVDLGLTSGTRWATCNIGATNPQDAGLCFSWAETAKKTSYGSGSYKYLNLSSGNLTKYCYRSDYGHNGYTDNKSVLDLSDDAARVNWGGAWRTPTEAQLSELINECFWVWTGDYNGSGVSGYIVYKAKTSADQGQVGDSGSPYTLSDTHIFLPYVNPGSGSTISGKGACCWSSTLDPGNPNYAWALKGTKNSRTTTGILRYDGIPVRGVISGK